MPEKLKLQSGMGRIVPCEDVHREMVSCLNFSPFYGRISPSSFCSFHSLQNICSFALLGLFWRLNLLDPWTTVDETDCTGKYDNGVSTAATKTVAVSQVVVSNSVAITQIDVASGSSTVATCTHAAASGFLAVGDTVTVSGHTGDASNVAVNQDYTVVSITSSTVSVLSGTGLTAGTYNTGSSKILTFGAKATCTHSAAVRGLVVGDSVTVSGHTGDAANLAVNQDYSVTHVTSATEIVMAGTGLTAGTYNSGSSKILTYSITAKGNLCHVECANRGLCNKKAGLCECFEGWYGSACTNRISILPSS